MAVNFSIHVPDIATVIASFDVVRLQRSETDEDGPWYDLTKAAADAASLTAANEGTYAISGLTLSLLVDDAQKEVTFDGTDPLSVADVVTDINDAFGAVIASDDANKLKLTSETTGALSRIEILGGTALDLLGFEEGDLSIGAEAYVTLVGGTSLYSFSDASGEPQFFYRRSFYNTTTGLYSEWSDPFYGTSLAILSTTLATLDLADLTGRALRDRQVSIYPVSAPIQSGGFGVDLGRDPVVLTTDVNGHAEVMLVRGSRVKVVFDGTSYIRTIDVPDADTFDLLDAVAAEDDQFDKAALPNLPVAPRRTV